MQQSLPDYLLLLVYTLGLKQLLFDYKKTRWIRDRLSSIPLLNELNHCVYCQAIEMSVVVYALLGRFSVDSLLAVLANGFVAIALDSLIRNAIMEMEKSREFIVNKEDGDREDESQGQSKTQSEDDAQGRDG